MNHQYLGGRIRDWETKDVDRAGRDVRVKRGLVIPQNELRFTFSRSSGPGGQNVNKLSTRVQLRFNLDASASLTAEQKSRIRQRIPGRILEGGDIQVVSERTRSRERNILDACDKLGKLLGSALKRTRHRIPTAVPTRAKKQRRADKQRRSAKKRLRERPGPDE
jgi:ribosome-associated protein